MNKELIFDLKSVRDRVSLIRLRYGNELSPAAVANLLQMELDLKTLSEGEQ